MATGGLLLSDLPAADREQAGIEKSKLALQVRHVGQYGDHAVGKRAGFQKDDVIVTFAGKQNRMSESDLMAYVAQNHMPGTSLPVTVIRQGKRIELALRMQ